MEVVSRRRSTIANLLYQYNALVLALINGVILVPIYLKFIDVKLYGAWLASGDIIGWLSIMDPGLNDLLRQQTAKFSGEKRWDLLGKSIGTSWLIIAFLSILSIIAGAVLSYFAPRWFSLEGANSQALTTSIFIAAIGMALVFLAGSPGSAQQGLQRSDKYLAIYLVGWVLGVATTLVMLFNGAGLLSIPIGAVVRGVVWFSGSSFDVLFVVKKKFNAHLGWSNEYFNEIRGLLSATLLNRIGRILAVNSDAFLVGFFLGPAVVPVIVFTKRLWDFAMMLTERLSVAFVPGLAHLLGDGKKERTSKIALEVLKVTAWMLAFGSALIISLNKSFIGIWVGKEFFAGNGFNILMSLAIIFFVFTSASNQLLYAAGIIKGPAIAGALQNLIRIVLLLILLRTVGGYGIPISILTTSALVIFFYLWKKTCALLDVRSYALAKTMIIPLVVGVTIGFTETYCVNANSWLKLVLVSFVISLISSATLFVVDSRFRSFAKILISRIVPM
jgi:O-antigen/teichoic acid export membrane protein